MAASKGSNAKKSGGSQKTGTKNRQSSARKGGTVKKQQESSVVFLDEILFLLAMAVSILLLLSNLHLCGSLGTRLYAFMHGTTGVLGYVFPFFFFGVMVFFISNRSNLTAMLRLWAAVVAFCCSAAFFNCLARQFLNRPGSWPYILKPGKRGSAAACWEGF